MNVGSCLLSVVPVRAEPSGKSVMVNQLLFGDRFSIVEQQQKWVKIITLHDQYEGWCESNQLNFLPDSMLQDALPQSLVGSVTASFINKQQSITLVYGSSLSLNENQLKVNETLYTLDQGEITPLLPADGQNLVNVTMKLVGSPYLWGGRSPFGIDCSGLIQVAFKMVGVYLPRDAWQQAQHPGEYIDLIAESQAGDVAFFDNEEGKIIHTGILTGNGTIIHASGRVRIDTIDHQGIFNHELGAYSHKLRIIKRFN